MSAPALSRGLEIIELLNKEGMLSLDEISRKLSVPKSSLIRLLNVLCEKGFVSRDSNEYKLIANIVKKTNGEDYFQSQLSIVLEKLALKASTTAEWFVTNEQGLLLISRFTPPDIEVSVKARIGFLRSWDEEFDSIAQIGYAMWGGAPNPLSGHLWVYGENKSKTILDDITIKNTLCSVKEKNIARDFSCNTNGVIRIASGIFMQDQLKGVLVLAMPCLLSIMNQIEKKQNLLLEHVKHLSS